MTTSVEPQQPRGNFVAFLNRDKQPGDNKPAFDGRLSLPGHDTQLPFPLWAHEYKDPKTGEVKIMFNGRIDAVSPTDAPLDQVATLLKEDGANPEATYSNLQLKARQLVLFPNGFKAEAPEKQRPDYWGAFNPGNNAPVVRLSVWLRKDRYQNALLTGATSYPLPGKSEVEQQDALAFEPQEATPEPSKGKGKASARGR